MKVIRTNSYELATRKIHTIKQNSYEYVQVFFILHNVKTAHNVISIKLLL